MFISRKEYLLMLVLGALAPAYAVEERIINATELIISFSQLNNTDAGKNILSQNIAAVISINNSSTEELRQQAIYDNTIAALFGSMSNGLLVSDALGETMSEIFAKNNSINENMYSASTFSSSFEKLLFEANTLTQENTTFAKNFYANGSIDGDLNNLATDITLPEDGFYNIYDIAYQPDNEHKNTVGNSRPVQVSADNIESFDGIDFFGHVVDGQNDILSTVVSNAAFPSGHSTFGFTTTLLFAEMIPELFQAFLYRGAEYANSRVVLGVHYPLDVIGARIMTLYTLTQILNNNPDYLNQDTVSLLGQTVTISNDFQSLIADAQLDLRSLLEMGCNSTIADCIVDNSTADELQKKKEQYTWSLTYGLSAIGPTDLAPVVPEGAEILLATRFPYLTNEQRRDVLATTEIESGHALDDGSGWARLNLYAAVDGYGAFNGDIHIIMDSSKGGFNAYDVWGNDITGDGHFIKDGSGALELTGNNSFSGTTTVMEGGLIINGYHGDSLINVQDNGSLSGTGTIGTLNVEKGAVIAPGNSIGTLSVKGDVIFDEGAFYLMQYSLDGGSDLIQSDGMAQINNADLVISLSEQGNLLQYNNVNSLLNQEMTILTALKGLSGEFNQLEPYSLFLDSSLNYTENSVILNFKRNDVLFTDIALTKNERSIASAIDSMAAGHPIYESMLILTNENEVRDIYHQLSGQIYADITSAMINDSYYLRDTLNQRLLQSSGRNVAPDIKVNSSGAWAKIHRAWGHASGTSNSRGYRTSNYGVLLGIDSVFDHGWQGGIVTGYTQATVDNGYRTNAEAHQYHIGVYGSKNFDNLMIRSGATYSLYNIDTKRSIQYYEQQDYLTGNYSANVSQIFIEVAQKTTFNNVNIEPFFNLAYVNMRSADINEMGGITALHANKQSADAKISILGLRAETELPIGQSLYLNLHHELGWQHQLDNVNRDMSLVLKGSNQHFTVSSVPASRNGAVVNVGADLFMSKNAKIYLDYSGSLSSNYQDNNVALGVNWTF